MSALNLSQQPKAKHPVVKTSQQCESKKHDALLTSFPLPRYFQVHFQHSHERTDAIHKELTELKTHINTLETKLNVLLLLLEKHRCDG